MRIAELAVILCGGVPVVGIGFAIRFALDCQILVLKQRYRISQLEAFLKWGYKRLAGEIELSVDIMGTIGLEERKLEWDDYVMT